MPSFSYGRMPSRFAAVVTVGALLALPVVALAGATKTITPKANGGVYMSRAKSSLQPSFVSFSVVKQGKEYRLSHFGIQCVVSARSLGAYIVEKGPTISSSGRFSFAGKAGVYKNDMPAPVGSATLRLTGRFTSSTKATGTAIITSARPALKDCPGKSFSANYSK